MTAPFSPTHRAPGTGLATWAVPDAAQPNGPALSADLPVTVEERLGDWARVRCSNGWEAWVDARRLVAAPAAVAAPASAPSPPPGPPPAPTSAPAGPLDQSPIRLGSLAVSAPLVGAAAALIGAFLPWVSQFGAKTTGWKVPVKFLLDPKTASLGGPKVAWIVVALAVGGGYLTLQPLSRQLRKACGWALVLVATVFLTQLQRQLSLLKQGGFQTGSVFSVLGLGVWLAAAGGLLIALGRGQES